MLEVEAVVTVVVEVVDVGAVEVPEHSWLRLMLDVVCKVHFSMTVYPAECYLILVHRIHSYLGSFA